MLVDGDEGPIGPVIYSRDFMLSSRFRFKTMFKVPDRESPADMPVILANGLFGV